MIKHEILLDTDIILDFFFDRKPYSDDTAEILNYCCKKVVKGYVTPVIVSNVYYLLRKKNKKEEVINCIQGLMMFIEVINIDKDTIMQALASEFNDFEDGLQYFSALDYGQIDYIITRNKKDFRKSALPVMTQSEFLGYIQTI